MIPLGILAAYRGAGTPGPGPGGETVTLTVPAQSEPLIGFPLYVDLATMPAEFWAGLAFDDGRDLRAFTGGGQPLPLDVVSCDRAAQTGEVFIRCDLSAAAATTVVLDFGDASRGAVLPTEPNGRNAVWSDYNRVFILTPAESGGKALAPDELSLDRTGNNLDYPDEIIGVQVKNLAGGDQGLCWDGTHYYVTSRTAIFKYDANWNLVTENLDPLSPMPGTNHCGDPDMKDGVIYVPVERYISVSDWSLMHIARYRADDLSFIGATDISAQGHEVSSFAIDQTSSELYVSSYAHNNNLWVYSLEGEFLRTLDFDSPIGLIQGIAFHLGKLFISSGADGLKVANRDGTNVRGVYWKGPSSNQGLASVDGELLIMRDGGAGGAYIYALRRGGVYLINCDKFDRWTVGATATNESAVATSQAIMSYGHMTSSLNDYRSTIAIRSNSGQSFGIWNSAQSWLSSTGGKADAGVPRRLHGMHDGAAARAVYVDGHETRQGTAALRPGGDRPALFIGQRDNLGGERFIGNFSSLAYLRQGVLSTAWIAAEVANLDSPATFYSVG